MKKKKFKKKDFWKSWLQSSFFGGFQVIYSHYLFVDCTLKKFQKKK